jgi:uncharacterized membrane protein YgdD (TMEM256/DUF423 family)
MPSRGFRDSEKRWRVAIAEAQGRVEAGAHAGDPSWEARAGRGDARCPRGEEAAAGAPPPARYKCGARPTAAAAAAAAAQELAQGLRRPAELPTACIRLCFPTSATVLAKFGKKTKRRPPGSLSLVFPAIVAVGVSLHTGCCLFSGALCRSQLSC